MHLKYFLNGFLASLLGATTLQAQHTFLPHNSESVYYYDRIQTLNGVLDTHTISLSGGVTRYSVAQYLNECRNTNEVFGRALFTPVENYAIYKVIGLNGEWVEDAEGIDAAQRRHKPILKYFYTTKENFYHYHDDDFFLSVNPVLDLNLGKDKNGENVYSNFRGAEVRGRILNKIGFYSILGDNQEKPFANVGLWEDRYKSFPTYEYYRRLEKGSFDAFVGRGYFNVDIIPNITNLTFGYDKQFIGNGIRSLVQSNETAASTFMKLTTKWKGFQLNNIYQELVADFDALGNDERLPKKYYSFHELSKNLTSKFQLGIFESTMYGYSKLKGITLIPVPIYNTIGRAVGANQKTSMGINAKYIPINNVQLYAQAMVDEINIAKSTNNIEKSKFATQLGLKLFNAFGLSQLDLQLEGNYVAPFMYQSNDKVKNNTHYNQPLAHNMGAGFAEVIGKLYYQPANRWVIQGLVSFYSINGNVNYYNNGNDLRLTYQAWKDDNTILYQNNYKAVYMNGSIGYELFTNFYLEIGGTYLNGTNANTPMVQNIMGFAGLRWNVGSRKNYMIYNF